MELPAIKESSRDYEALERAIREFFLSEIYLPLLKRVGDPAKRVVSKIRNDDRGPVGLKEALLSGRVTYHDGIFSGSFSAEISKDLRALGATFRRQDATYRLEYEAIPDDVKRAISLSEGRFLERIEEIDGHLKTLERQDLSSRLSVDHFFERALGRVDGEIHRQWKKHAREIARRESPELEFQESVRRISVPVRLSEEQKKRIASEWGDNMRLWIKDFTRKEIGELRRNVQKTILSGNRYGSLVKTIEQSYGVSARKAKFLARQETNLLMSKFKETRYQDAGVQYYRWVCVAGTKAHPTRPSHKALDGLVFRFDDPPVTTAPGEPQRKNNPGCDYNCRCSSRALVGYRGPTGVKAPR